MGRQKHEKLGGVLLSEAIQLTDGQTRLCDACLV